MAIAYVGLISNVYALTGGVLEKDNYEEYLKRNWDLVQLSTKVQNKIKEYYKIEKEYEDEYPNYYGGIYLNDDATFLIIQIVKDKIPKENDDDYKIYKEILDMDSKIRIEYVDYSFNDLNKVNNNVSDYMTLKDINNDNVTGTYIDVMSNTIVVEVLENNDKEKQKIIRNITMGKNNIQSMIDDDSKLITFKYGGIITNNRDIYPGGQAYKNASCTTGVRIYYNGNGYLTAGHCVKGLKYVSIGDVWDAKYTDGGYYDYAYIHITDNQTNITNKLEETSPDGLVTKLAVVDYCPSITTNMEIAKVGNATGYTSGKVTGLNQTVKIKKDNYTIHGVIKSNLKSDEGDSGGPVFIPKIDALGGAVPIGILNSGETNLFGIQKAMYFTSINDLPTYLQNRY